MLHAGSGTRVSSRCNIHVFTPQSAHLHFLRFITGVWCWYCIDIFRVLRPHHEAEGVAVCRGRGFLTDGMFVLGAGYHLKSERKRQITCDEWRQLQICHDRCITRAGNNWTLRGICFKRYRAVPLGSFWLYGYLFIVFCLNRISVQYSNTYCVPVICASDIC